MSIYADSTAIVEQLDTPSFAEQMVTQRGAMGEPPPLVAPVERDSLVDVTLVEWRTEWLVEALRKLTVLASLKMDWDGCGSDPPAEIAVRSARNILLTMAENDFAPSGIDATSEGGVCISFRDGNRYADIESFANGEVLAVITERGATPEVWPLAITSQDIAASLNRIRRYLA
jgi:hypothetical protein